MEVSLITENWRGSIGFIHNFYYFFFMILNTLNFILDFKLIMMSISLRFRRTI